MMAPVGPSISRMPGPPLGVTDHDHIAFLDLAGEDGFHGFFLGIKRTRSAGKAQAFLAGDLSHGAFGGEVAVEHNEVAVFLDRFLERLNDLLPFGIRLHASEILRERFAGDGHAITV